MKETSSGDGHCPQQMFKGHFPVDNKQPGADLVTKATRHCTQYVNTHIVIYNMSMDVTGLCTESTFREGRGDGQRGCEWREDGGQGEGRRERL